MVKPIAKEIVNDWNELFNMLNTVNWNKIETSPFKQGAIEIFEILLSILPQTKKNTIAQMENLNIPIWALKYINLIDVSAVESGMKKRIFTAIKKMLNFNYKKHLGVLGAFIK